MPQVSSLKYMTLGTVKWCTQLLMQYLPIIICNDGSCKDKDGIVSMPSQWRHSRAIQDLVWSIAVECSTTILKAMPVRLHIKCHHHIMTQATRSCTLYTKLLLTCGVHASDGWSPSCSISVQTWAAEIQPAYILSTRWEITTAWWSSNKG